MICDVCGRNNADNLTFCQDCGRRLRQRRGVAPTPPNGMPVVTMGNPVALGNPVGVPQTPPVGRDGEPRGVPQAPPGQGPAGYGPVEAAPDSGRGSSSGPPSAGRRSRPAAPVFSFAPQTAPAVAPEPHRQAGAVAICVECQTPNPPEYRFCVTCGTSLQRAAEGPAPRPAPPPAPSAPVGPPPAAFESERIVGAPVVDIAASGATPATIVTCGRCHGHCIAGSRFCKYCGNALDEPPRRVVEALPAPAAPAVVEQRRPFEVGKVPLAPIGRDPDGVPSSSGASLRPAVIPPTPAPLPVQPAPPPPPVPAPVEPAHVEAARPPIPNTPPTPPPPRIEDPQPAGYPGYIPGVRTEISALAGSPVPAEPLIPSPPPPREPHHHEGAAARPRAGADAVPTRPVGPQPPGRWKGGRLVVIVEDGSEGRSFSLAEGQLDVGRTDGDIVLEDDPYVSPRHARLRRGDARVEGGAWFLRDLDSTNHVYVRLRKPHAMRDGDLLLLGLEVLQFQTVSDGERGLGHAIQHGTFLFGSPATPRRARLCQRTVEGVIRDVYHLFRDETIIGREVGDIVFTADPFLSRRHASILRNPVTSEFALVDLDSSNGTYVAIRGEVAVSDGDFLRIGQHLFRVDLG